MPQLLHFPGRTRTINVAREIGVQYQLVGTALLDDTRGTIVPAILETCHHIIERVNTELLRTWVQDEVIGDRSWHSLIGVLRSSGCEALADDIEEAACSPETGSSSPCELLCMYYCHLQASYLCFINHDTVISGHFWWVLNFIIFGGQFQGTKVKT